MTDRRITRDTVPNFAEPDTEVEAADTSRMQVADTDQHDIGAAAAAGASGAGAADTDRTRLPEAPPTREPSTWPKSATLPFARGKRRRSRAMVPVRLDARSDSSAPHDRPGVGRRYLNYEIRRRLARGSMGLVYEAVHLHLDRRVAIKFLSPSLLEDKGIVYRFLGEARAMARIDHPGVPRVFDFGQDQAGNAYLVMDYLHGESLAERIERDPPDLAQSLEFAAQVVEVLAAAHAQGIVHRDLKPENIILCRSRVRLIDFGVCKASWDTRDDTLAGNLIGTPRYMAPEQTTSESITAKTDVYALGCVVYELVAGSPPFSGSIAELVDAHRSERPADLRRHDPSIPPALAELVASMLEKRQSARPKAGGGLARTLRALARNATSDGIEEDDEPDPVVTLRRRPPLPLPRAATAQSAIERGLLGPTKTPVPFHPPAALLPQGSVDIRKPGALSLEPGAGHTTQLTIGRSRKSAVLFALLALAAVASMLAAWAS